MGKFHSIDDSNFWQTNRMFAMIEVRLAENTIFLVDRHNDSTWNSWFRIRYSGSMDQLIDEQSIDVRLLTFDVA